MKTSYRLYLAFLVRMVWAAFSCASRKCRRRENAMKTINLSVATAAAFAMLAVGSAGAQCIGVPHVQKSAGGRPAMRAGLLRAGYQFERTGAFPSAAIVGMWHVKLTATAVSNGVPFGPG